MTKGKRWRGCVAGLGLLLLSACGLLPPPEGVANAGPLGLDGLAASVGVHPLDPGSAVPLTKQALEEIEKTDPLRVLRGTTYRLSQGNRLPADWLVQTPNAWDMPGAAVRFVAPDCPHCDADFGLPACRVPADCDDLPCRPLHASISRPGMRARSFCVGQSDAVVDRYYDLVVSARRAVDITMLQPPADGRFLAALRNALTMLAASGRAVTIRVMVGDFPPDGTDPAPLLRGLLRDAAGVPGERLRVFAGVTRSCNGGKPCDTLSWNHAKIVAVDGERALVGGHNLWTGDYLRDAPVHDVSMVVEGPAAHDAHRFADALWRFVCARPADDAVNLAYEAEPGRTELERGCLARIALPEARAEGGGVSILAVGRLATGMQAGFDDQSLIARDLMLGAATKTIRMVQQDAGFSIAHTPTQWPDSALRRMADLIARQGDVYLVLSNPGAEGKIGDYSNGIDMGSVADHIRDLVAARTGLDAHAVAALVCRRLHLAPLRFGPDATWPDATRPGGRPIGVHAKLWMVDDRVFYIGSENLYPVDLQEFGYIVEDRAASATLRAAYWDRVWRWSRAAAITGEAARPCRYEAGS